MRQQATRKLPEEIDGSDNNDMQNFSSATVLAEPEPAPSPILPSAMPEPNSSPEPAPATVTNLPTAKETSRMNAKASTLGTLLSQTREEHGLSIDEAADRLYLETRIVEALEKERYDKLPPVIFVQGYLRSYSRLLNLPTDDVLRAYYQATDQTPPKLASESKAREHINQADDSPRRTLHWWNGFTIIIVFIIIGLVAWRYAGTLSLPNLFGETPTDNNTPAVDTELPSQLQLPETSESETGLLLPPNENSLVEYTPPTESVDDNGMTASDTEAVANSETSTSTTENTAETTETTLVLPPPNAEAGNNTVILDSTETDTANADVDTEATATATATATAETPSFALAIDFSAESWVSITDASGTRLVYGTAKAGEQRRIEQINPPIRVVIGRPGAVTNFSFQGEPVDLSKYKNSVAKFTLR